MTFDEKKIAENLKFDGHIIRVHVDDVLLPNGDTTFREVVDHPGGVCVAALSDEGTLSFVRQFRYPYGRTLLELPAGKLEYGEDPVDAGKRELSEECGLVSDDFVPMGVVYPTVAYCGEIIHLFLAKGLYKTEQHLDDDEFLSVEQISLDDAVSMVMNNEIEDSKTQVLIMKLFYLKENGLL